MTVASEVSAPSEIAPSALRRDGGCEVLGLLTSEVPGGVGLPRRDEKEGFGLEGVASGTALRADAFATLT